MDRLSYLYFKGKVLLQVLYYHHQEGQLYAQGLTGISWTTDESGTDISANNLQHKRLNVIVCYSLDVPVPHLRRTVQQQVKTISFKHKEILKRSSSFKHNFDSYILIPDL